MLRVIVKCCHYSRWIKLCRLLTGITALTAVILFIMGDDVISSLPHRLTDLSNFDFKNQTNFSTKTVSNESSWNGNPKKEVTMTISQLKLRYKLRNERLNEVCRRIATHPPVFFTHKNVSKAANWTDSGEQKWTAKRPAYSMSCITIWCRWRDGRNAQYGPFLTTPAHLPDHGMLRKQSCLFFFGHSFPASERFRSIIQKSARLHFPPSSEGIKSSLTIWKPHDRTTLSPFIHHSPWRCFWKPMPHTSSSCLWGIQCVEHCLPTWTRWL